MLSFGHALRMVVLSRVYPDRVSQDLVTFLTACTMLSPGYDGQLEVDLKILAHLRPAANTYDPRRSWRGEDQMHHCVPPGAMIS